MSQKWHKSSLLRAEFHGLGNTSNGARFEPHIAFGIKLRARLQNQQATRTGFFVVNVQYRLFLPHCACRLPNGIAHYTMLAFSFGVLYLGLFSL